jgi:hypothetical protein
MEGGLYHLRPKFHVVEAPRKPFGRWSRALAATAM